MPIDLDKVSQIKERILSIIRLKGPTLPIQVAKALNISPLFTSAFLSELFSERKVFMSHMKIGSSSLYLLPGQEQMLENFIDSLNVREKEAVLQLKAKRLLEDDSLTPVIRVALRSTKDFAIPVKIKINNEPKIFWKYYMIQDSDIKNILQETIIQSPLPAQAQQKLPEPEKQKQEEVLEIKTSVIPEIKQTPQPPQVQEEKPKVFYNIIEKPAREIQREPIKEQIKEEETKHETKPTIKHKEESIETEETEPEIAKKEKPKKKEKESEFTRKIKAYLMAKDIEIIEIIEEKKKEFYAKVRTDESFGKQEYYLIAKDKKKINDLDLIISLQKAQENKMQALIMVPGDIDKKALDYYNSWKNMIKFHKIKI